MRAAPRAPPAKWLDPVRATGSRRRNGSIPTPPVRLVRAAPRHMAAPSDRA
ncbi:hypothetical protein [Streptomyces sp. S1]|uniref:hypothetical protein n=1 Tax=Streptomyces sp. S1 TaxID=718288 RepID=UPI003D7570D3